LLKIFNIVNIRIYLTNYFYVVAIMKMTRYFNCFYKFSCIVFKFLETIKYIEITSIIMIINDRYNCISKTVKTLIGYLYWYYCLCKKFI